MICGWIVRDIRIVIHKFADAFIAVRVIVTYSVSRIVYKATLNYYFYQLHVKSTRLSVSIEASEGNVLHETCTYQYFPCDARPFKSRRVYGKFAVFTPFSDAVVT